MMLRRRARSSADRQKHDGGAEIRACGEVVLSLSLSRSHAHAGKTSVTADTVRSLLLPGRL